ncbi:ETC complex I subunit [uncultured Maricaulis sp.]|uniref:ETC complex I subunit n=1 Tax=uncultured Maricaulis sp. TaxID=174710 RepID=UPI002605F5E8|nr:ETC complex I subunit [uncultured Maricaulis sp.]
MFAKIYRPARNAMQSGRGKTKRWVLEFSPEMAKRPDPLMGWTSSSDMRGQIKLTFDSQEDAVAYAKRQGIPFQVVEPHEPKRYAKSYADNFAADRKQPWSH